MTRKCAECGGDHEYLYLHSRCHPDAPTWIGVSEHDIVVQCCICNKEVARFSSLEQINEWLDQ